MFWRLLHLTVAMTWSAMFCAMLTDLVQHGDLPRKAVAAGHYEASFVMFMTLLLAATITSALRALWIGSDT